MRVRGEMRFRCMLSPVYPSTKTHTEREREMTNEEENGDDSKKPHTLTHRTSVVTFAAAAREVSPSESANVR